MVCPWGTPARHSPPELVRDLCDLGAFGAGADLALPLVVLNEWLTQHRRIEALVHKAIATALDGDAREAASLVRRLQSQVCRHNDFEESTLLEAFERQAHDIQTTLSLRREHRRIRERMAVIEQAVVSGELGLAVESLRAMSSLLEQHFKEEEALFYEIFTRLIPPVARPAGDGVARRREQAK